MVGWVVEHLTARFLQLLVFVQQIVQTESAFNRNGRLRITRSP